MRGVWDKVIPTKCQRVKAKVAGPDGALMIEHAIAVSLNSPTQTVPGEIVRFIGSWLGVELGAQNAVRPRVLIGQDNLSLIQTRETRLVTGTGLAVSRTSLGWVVHGFITGRESWEVLSACVEVSLSESTYADDSDLSLEQLNELVRKFIMTESLGMSDQSVRKVVPEATMQI